MSRGKNIEEIGISAPSTIKGGKAIRVVVRNPKRFSLIAKWSPELIEKMKFGGVAAPRVERFGNLNEAVAFFKGIGIGIAKARIVREWDSQRYTLACGAVLVATAEGNAKFDAKILVEWPFTGVSVETRDKAKFAQMIGDGVDMPFVNTGTFVSFCVGMGVMGVNYRKINNALKKYGDSYEVAGIATLTSVPIISYGTSAKGNKQITTNTKYKEMVNKFEAVKDLGIDVDRILENAK